jgi:MFS family permease
LHRNYAFFWSSDVLSSTGHFVKEVALYWVAYEITGSALALGVLGLCEAGPRLILSVFGGVLVDRYDRLRLLVLMEFVSAVPVFLLVALYFAGVLQFWHILVLEMAFSIVRSIGPSASQSLIRDLVPEEELMNAVALFTIGFNSARVVGPSLGGVLILWIGVGGCFLVFAVSLLVSGFVQLLLIRIPKRVVEAKRRDLLVEIKEGFHYIWNAPVILSSIGAAYTVSVFLGTYPRFLPVFAKEVLRVGPEGLGILHAAPGVGAILSLIFLSSVGETWRRDALLWFTTSLAPLFLILFCLSRSFWFSVVVLTLVGSTQIAFRTISRVPTVRLGRVMSVFVMDQGMRSVGSIVIGAFATFFGAPLGLALTSMISLSITSTLFYRLLGWRR